jgi:hypothetical protein
MVEAPRPAGMKRIEAERMIGIPQAAAERWVARRLVDALGIGSAVGSVGSWYSRRQVAPAASLSPSATTRAVAWVVVAAAVAAAAAACLVDRLAEAIP